MNTYSLARGLVLGFSIAAPVGAIGVLCIRRTLSDGTLAGFISGLGAASADALYAMVAVAGVHSVSEFLNSHETAIRILGGVFLAYIGVRTFLSRPPGQDRPSKSTQLSAAYGSTFLLTLANPSTVVSFGLVFGALASQGRGPAFEPAATVFGVFLGSTAWWLFLSVAVGILRSRIDFHWMQAVNRGAGILLFALGVGILCRS
jgi:threonine/homoserine/homoserine lactone efflux protein